MKYSVFLQQWKVWSVVNCPLLRGFPLFRQDLLSKSTNWSFMNCPLLRVFHYSGVYYIKYTVLGDFKPLHFVQTSVMGPRGLQNIFQFCNFLVSGASFEHIQLHQFFQHIKLLEKWPNFQSFQHSKNMIFRINSTMLVKTYQ